jgi:hypothetical protein
MTTTIEGSGRTREPGEIFRKPLKDSESLADSGFVLTAVEEASIQKVKASTSTDFPLCINYRSTRDPFDLAHPPTTFLIGSSTRLPTIDCVDDGEFALKVVNDNAAIAVGDPLVVGATAGKVDKYTPTSIGDTSTGNRAAQINDRFKELGRIVGYAVEKIAAGGGGLPGADKVRTRLTIKQCPTIA